MREGRDNLTWMALFRSRKMKKIAHDDRAARRNIMQGGGRGGRLVLYYLEPAFFLSVNPHFCVQNCTVFIEKLGQHCAQILPRCDPAGGRALGAWVRD